MKDSAAAGSFYSARRMVILLYFECSGVHWINNLSRYELILPQRSMNAEYSAPPPWQMVDHHLMSDLVRSIYL